MRYVHRALAELLRGEAAIAEVHPAIISERTGIKAPTVRRILKGEREVQVVELLQICSMFRLSYSAMIERAVSRAVAIEQADVDAARQFETRLRENF